MDFKSFVFACNKVENIDCRQNFFKDIDINSLIFEDMIYIDEIKFKELSSKLTKDEFEYLLSYLIDFHKLPFPHKKHTINEVEKDFINLMLYNIANLPRNGACYTKIPRKNLPNYYLFNEKTGRLASDYFQKNNRIKTSNKSSNSPYSKWYEPSRRSWLRSVITKGFLKGYIDENILRHEVSCKYTAAQFPPAIAKFIYEKFEIKNVIDFSSGWGDRLCGFYASSITKKYIGIDPNKLVHDAYIKQIELYSRLTDKKSVELINDAAEDVNFSQFKNFDAIFTSPPYFNVERYAMDIKQSWIKYKVLDDWLNEFLYKVLTKSLFSVKPNGYIIINIADSSNACLCDPLLNYMENLPVEFVGCIPLKIASHGNKQLGIAVEPIFVWKKL